MLLSLRSPGCESLNCTAPGQHRDTVRNNGGVTASTTRRILALAVPSLGALVAQPLMVLADTAMVGHLGEQALAGLAVGSTMIATATGLMVFLAYTTTPLVARRLGAGDRPGAIRAGIDGMWLGLGCGVALLLLMLAVGPAIVPLFTDDPLAQQAATQYLTLSAWGLPGMLVVIAATGLLRGLQDARSPLIIATAGAVINVVLNYLLIYPAGLGIAGAALGTAIAESLMAAVYVVIAMRAAARHGVGPHPAIGDPRRALVDSGLMFARTVTLRVSILLLVWSGGAIGVSELAALQVLFTLFNLMAFILDALAIAAQAMIGHDLGAGDTSRVRELVRILLRWGVGLGLVLATVLALIAPMLGRLFTSDAAVLELLPASFWALAVTLPLCAVVFVLDGVLIGASDIAYLALVGVINLLVFAALTGVLLLLQPSGIVGVVSLWAAFGGGFMLSRAITLAVRTRGDRWLTQPTR